MSIIIDARNLRMYPVGKPGFTGGTELLVRRLVRGLADKGHTVHVVTPDLDENEQRGEREFWWSPRAFPTRTDVVVAVHNLTGVEAFTADALVYLTNGIDPYLGPEGQLAELVSAFPVFSQTHGKMLCQANPTVPPERVVVTGLGVDLDDYSQRFDPGGGLPIRTMPNEGRHEPGRMWVGNDPARGLWHVLDIFERVRAEVPEASLHITYDIDRVIEAYRWHQTALAEMLLECERRIPTLAGVVKRGALSRAETITEQRACQVHCWPSDPPNRGSQIHGLSQIEAAAAGAALVLSDIEAFPEVFGDAATILPTIGTFDPTAERRVNALDYAEVIVELMQDGEKWADASQKARALAEQHTWRHVIDRWDAMLTMLTEGT